MAESGQNIARQRRAFLRYKTELPKRIIQDLCILYLVFLFAQTVNAATKSSFNYRKELRLLRENSHDESYKFDDENHRATKLKCRGVECHSQFLRKNDLNEFVEDFTYGNAIDKQKKDDTISFRISNSYQNISELDQVMIYYSDNSSQIKSNLNKIKNKYKNKMQNLINLKVTNELKKVNVFNELQNFSEKNSTNVTNVYSPGWKRVLRSLAYKVYRQPKFLALHPNSSQIKQKRMKRRISTLNVEVIAGSSASLPCDLSMKTPQNSVQLVLWIKEGMNTPLYSFDFRELLNGYPKEKKPDSHSTLAQRTSFKTGKEAPAVLLIEKAQREDTGMYRCRVDFLLTPTRNSRVNLTVIVPPSRAKVKWKYQANSLAKIAPDQNGKVGPFRVAQRPVLICSNDDGFPLPRVLWYERDKMIDESFVRDNQQVTNEMQLLPLKRSDLWRRFTCQVSNVNISQPATTTVIIGIILNILAVEIVIPDQLEAKKSTNIRCNVWGSRPAPIINWWLGSTKLESSHLKALNEGNVTVGVLAFTPKGEDDSAMLICQAINPKIVDDVIQDTKLLSVNYAPTVSIRLGSSLNPSRIKEGDDVYFECSVQAKPSAFKVQWKHDDALLEGGNGIFVSNMSLVVQKVTRSNGGEYTCHAINTVGLGISPPLSLDVKYSPVCVSKETKQYSVARLENAEILCRVHANPPKVAFKWTFNNTAEAIDVPEGRFVVTGTDSRVNYTPMNELDYGTLLCWANNSIGIQKNPCVFQIVTAGKPDPPHNCRIFDVTISSLQVSCLPGGDGGLIQQFLIQVFKIGSTSPTTEISRPSPSFSVTNLRPATAYKILVASINDKGASRPTELKVYTERVPEIQEETSAVFLPEPTRDREGEFDFLPILIILGCTGATVILLITIVLWVRTYHKRGSASTLGMIPRSGGSTFELPLSGSTETISCKKLDMSSELSDDMRTPYSTQNASVIMHSKRKSAETSHARHMIATTEQEIHGCYSNIDIDYSNVSCDMSMPMPMHHAAVEINSKVNKPSRAETSISPSFFYSDNSHIAPENMMLVTTSFSNKTLPSMLRTHHPQGINYTQTCNSTQCGGLETHGYTNCSTNKCNTLQNPNFTTCSHSECDSRIRENQAYASCSATSCNSSCRINPICGPNNELTASLHRKKHEISRNQCYAENSELQDFNGLPMKSYLTQEHCDEKPFAQNLTTENTISSEIIASVPKRNPDGILHYGSIGRRRA